MPALWMGDLGPVEVTHNGNVIGDTHTGATIRYTQESRDTFRDKTGVEAHDSILVGSISEIETNLAENDLEKLVNVIPGSTLSSGPTKKSLTLSSAVGRSMRDNAATLILKPIIDGSPTTDQQLWTTAALAHPLATLELVADMETQRIYKIMWKIFSNLTTGDHMVFGVDQA